MQRVRLAFVGLVALVGVIALSGCQANPNRAATMGSLSIDHADVDATVAVIEADLAKAQQNLPAEAYGDVRRTVVEFTVFNELARRYAKERGIALSAPDYAAAAEQIGLPVEDPYVRLYAESNAYRTDLLAKAKPVTPTETDMRETYDRYRALAGDQAESYDTVKAELLKLPDYQTGLGLRDELVAAAKRYGLVVNPRYSPMSVPLAALSNGQLVLVSLPLGDQGTGAVRDI
jgi:hypothetical protein